MELLYWGFIESRLGGIVIVESAAGVMSLDFGGPGQIDDLLSTGDYGRGGPLRTDVLRQVEEYLAGRRKHFDVPLDLRGTHFQKSVWRELMRIPYGETRTYSDIAKSIGIPKGSRAVGQATSKNPVAIIVPCHRVVEHRGLGGYSGGLGRKKLLLGIEGVRLYR
jgi:methylated-DNA-[protein]-cysteine S-methyltransferase